MLEGKVFAAMRHPKRLNRVWCSNPLGESQGRIAPTKMGQRQACVIAAKGVTHSSFMDRTKARLAAPYGRYVPNPKKAFSLCACK